MIVKCGVWLIGLFVLIGLLMMVWLMYGVNCFNCYVKVVSVGELVLLLKLCCDEIGDFG